MLLEDFQKCNIRTGFFCFVPPFVPVDVPEQKLLRRKNRLNNLFRSEQIAPPVTRALVCYAYISEVLTWLYTAPWWLHCYDVYFPAISIANGDQERKVDHQLLYKHQVLGCVLAYYTDTISAKTLCQTFGIVPSTLSRTLKLAEEALDRSLSDLSVANVGSTASLGSCCQT